MIKATIMAKIDGDQIRRVLKIPEMKVAEWRVALEITLGDATVTCETLEDVVAFVEAMRASDSAGEPRAKG